MMGIPAFAGFASKLSLTMASFDHPYIIWALTALCLSSVLNALYYVPAVIVILTKKNNNPELKSNTEFLTHRITNCEKISIFVFLALNFYLGLFCMPLLNLITKGVNVL